MLNRLRSFYAQVAAHSSIILKRLPFSAFSILALRSGPADSWRPDPYLCASLRLAPLISCDAGGITQSILILVEQSEDCSGSKDDSRKIGNDE